MPAFEGQTVLVVDAQPQIRRLIRQALRPWGVVTLEAADGQEALAVSKQHEGGIALAILDCLMPGLGGLDLGAELGRRMPGVRVLYMLSAMESIATQSLLRESPEVVLLKPFTLQELLRRVRFLLESPR